MEVSDGSIISQPTPLFGGCRSTCEQSLFGIWTRWRNPPELREGFLFATPVETVAIGSDATGDRGILFDQQGGNDEPEVWTV